jgi:RHS repeat-associated protein
MTYTPSDSSWLITNAAGDETAFYGYDAFGNLAFGTPESPFGYAGEYTDPSTGLSDLRARWYEPQTGSFTTRDPAFTSTDTAYTYANDDPVNGSDPTGLSASCVHSCLAEVSTTAANDIDRHPQMAYVFQDMSTQWDDIVVPYASQEVVPLSVDL